MASSPYDRAQMAAHDRAASRRFPGPDFRQVLRWIHEAMRPAAYVEIGVGAGCSLAAVQPDTLAIGIDPHPDPQGCWPAGSRIFRIGSSEFFATHDLRRFLGGKPLDLALIDGFHLFEQALEDLCNLESYIAPGGVIALHDTIPLDRETSARLRTTEFYAGDVWKIVPLSAALPAGAGDRHRDRGSHRPHPHPRTGPRVRSCRAACLRRRIRGARVLLLRAAS